MQLLVVVLHVVIKNLLGISARGPPRAHARSTSYDVLGCSYRSCAADSHLDGIKQLLVAESYASNKKPVAVRAQVFKEGSLRRALGLPSAAYQSQAKFKSLRIDSNPPFRPPSTNNGLLLHVEA